MNNDDERIVKSTVTPHEVKITLASGVVIRLYSNQDNRLHLDVGHNNLRPLIVEEVHASNYLNIRY